MSKKNNLKFVEKRNIIKKIDFFTFGFIFAMSVTIISSITSIYYTLHILNALKNMYELDVVGANYTQKAIVNRLNIENELKTIILNDKNESIEKNIDNIKSFKNDFFDNMEKAEPLFTSDTGKKYFKDAKISADKYFKIIDAFLIDSSQDKKKSALKSLKESSKVGKDLHQKLDGLDNFKQRKNLNFDSTIIIIFQTNLLIIVSILLISIIIRIVLYINQKKQIKRSRIFLIKHNKIL